MEREYPKTEDHKTEHEDDSAPIQRNCGHVVAIGGRVARLVIVPESSDMSSVAKRPAPILGIFIACLNKYREARPAEREATGEVAPPEATASKTSKRIRSLPSARQTAFRRVRDEARQADEDESRYREHNYGPRSRRERVTLPARSRKE